MIEPGQQAPDFSVVDEDGREVKLSDFRGEPVVVYFYATAETRDYDSTEWAHPKIEFVITEEPCANLGLTPEGENP